MADTVEITWPTYALATKPVPLDGTGKTDFMDTYFWVINSEANGPRLLLLFRKQNLVRLFLEENKPEFEAHRVQIDSEDALNLVLRILRYRCKHPVGVLLDPDGEMNGYPILPKEWVEDGWDQNSEDEEY